MLFLNDNLVHLLNSRKANESSKEMMGRVSLNVKLPAELKAYNFFPGSIILEFHYEPSQDQQSASSNVSDDEHSDVSMYQHVNECKHEFSFTKC